MFFPPDPFRASVHFKIHFLPWDHDEVIFPGSTIRSILSLKLLTALSKEWLSFCSGSFIIAQLSNLPFKEFFFCRFNTYLLEVKFFVKGLASVASQDASGAIKLNELTSFFPQSVYEVPTEGNFNRSSWFITKKVSFNKSFQAELSF